MSPREPVTRTVLPTVEGRTVVLSVLRTSSSVVFQVQAATTHPDPRALSASESVRLSRTEAVALAHALVTAVEAEAQAEREEADARAKAADDAAAKMAAGLRRPKEGGPA